MVRQTKAIYILTRRTNANQQKTTIHIDIFTKPPKQGGELKMGKRRGEVDTQSEPGVELSISKLLDFYLHKKK